MRLKLQFVFLLAIAIAKAMDAGENSDTNMIVLDASDDLKSTDSTTGSSTTEATDPSSSSTTEATDPSGSSTTEPTDPSSSSTTEATDPSDSSTTEETDTSGSSTTEATDTSGSSTTEATDPSGSSTSEATETSGSSTTEATDPSSSSTTEETDTSDSSSISTSTTEPLIGVDDYPMQVAEDGKPPCILVKMNITLKVSYETNNKTIASVSLPIPEEVKVSGSCGNDTSTMILSWSVPSTFETEDKMNEVSFHFKKEDERFSLDKIEMEIILDEKTFPDAKNKTLTTSTAENLNLFAASATDSKYVCSDETVVSAKKDESSQGIQLSITDVSLIAFNDRNDVSSRSEENCLKGETVEASNVGAIVGGIIGALVIIGIIGFVIWRRKRNSYAQSEVP